MATFYEEAADLMMTTLAGEMSGLTRDQFVTLFKQKYPDEAQFRAFTDSIKQQAQASIDAAQSQLKPGQILAVGIPVTQKPQH